MKHEPLHRDDIDADTVAEIEKMFQELHPGFKVQFAGDIPGATPPGYDEAVAQIERMGEDSLANGTCVDCGCQMPDYEPGRKGWKPAVGWGMFHDIKTNEPRAWQCKECDEAEEDGVPKLMNLSPPDTREEP